MHNPNNPNQGTETTDEFGVARPPKIEAPVTTKVEEPKKPEAPPKPKGK